MPLVAFIATGGQAIDPAPWPGAETAAAAGATLGITQQWLGTRGRGTLAEHQRAVFLRGADGAVIAQEQLAIAAGDAAFLSGTGLIGRLRRRAAQQHQAHREKGFQPPWVRALMVTPPGKKWPDNIKLQRP